MDFVTVLDAVWYLVRAPFIFFLIFVAVAVTVVDLFFGD